MPWVVADSGLPVTEMTRPSSTSARMAQLERHPWHEVETRRVMAYRALRSGYLPQQQPVPSLPFAGSAGRALLWSYFSRRKPLMFSGIT